MPTEDTEVVVFVITACCFEGKDKLCRTTVKRLQAAAEKARWQLPESYFANLKVYFYVTGNVPYEKGSRTLDALMEEFLVTESIRPEQIMRGKGFGIFSEANDVSRRIANIVETPRTHKRMILVSSDWYFWAALPVWRYFASYLYDAASLTLIRIRKTGGWRTWLMYLAYGVVIRVFFLLGLHRTIKDIMNRAQASRKQGFRFRGCA